MGSCQCPTLEGVVIMSLDRPDTPGTDPWLQAGSAQQFHGSSLVRSHLVIS